MSCQLAHQGATFEMISAGGCDNFHSEKTADPFENFECISYTLKDFPDTFMKEKMREPVWRGTWKDFKAILKGRDESSRKDYSVVTVEQVHGRLYFHAKTKSTCSRIMTKEQQIFDLFDVAQYVSKVNGAFDRRTESPTTTVALFGYMRPHTDRTKEEEAENLRRFFEEENSLVSILQFRFRDDHIIAEIARSDTLTQILQTLGWITLDGQRIKIFKWKECCELLFCYDCFRPGHKAYERHLYRERPHCGGCGEEGHTINDCEQDISNCENKCPNCFGPHAAWGNSCRYGPTLDMRKKVVEARRKIAGPYFPEQHINSIWNDTWKPEDPPRSSRNHRNDRQDNSRRHSGGNASQHDDAPQDVLTLSQRRNRGRRHKYNRANHNNRNSDHNGDGDGNSTGNGDHNGKTNNGNSTGNANKISSDKDDDRINVNARNQGIHGKTDSSHTASADPTDNDDMTPGSSDNPAQKSHSRKRPCDSDDTTSVTKDGPSGPASNLSKRQRREESQQVTINESQSEGSATTTLKKVPYCTNYAYQQFPGGIIIEDPSQPMDTKGKKNGQIETEKSDKGEQEKCD